MKSAVYAGTLMHNRLKPRQHHFRYQVSSWIFDLDELEELNKKLTFFSFNRFNLISFYENDYGDWSETGRGDSLKGYVNRLLKEQELPKPARVELLCYPRILGYVFNPLAVYFCYGGDQALQAVIYEVTNTFGERHSYVIPADDAGEIIRQQAMKRLHVSPFFETDNHFYRFRIQISAQTVSLGISLHNQSGRLFCAVFSGLRKEVCDRFVLQQLVALPFMTLKVMGAIHWEALRLWLKGISIVPHKVY